LPSEVTICGTVPLSVAVGERVSANARDRDARTRFSGENSA